MDYQKLYTMLFNAYERAINHIEKQNYGLARDVLIEAQQAAEEAYLSQEDQHTDCPQ